MEAKDKLLRESNFFEGITGQEIPKRILESMVNNNRLPHSFLFYGPYGVGKKEVAFILSKHLLCENGPPACNRCMDCNQFVRGVHPDLHIVIPLPSALRKIVSEDRYNFQKDYIKTRISKNRFNITEKGERSISIDDVRFIKEILSVSSQRGKARIVLIDDAHKMGIEASNAFLKILEEPYPASYIFLITTNKDALLPTIISRCFLLQFRNLTDSEVNEFLLSKGFGPAEAKIRTELAQGSIKRALIDFNEEEIYRELSKIFISLFEERDILKLIDFAEDLYERFDREEMEAFLNQVEYSVRLRFMSINNDNLQNNDEARYWFEIWKDIRKLKEFNRTRANMGLMLSCFLFKVNNYL